LRYTFLTHTKENNKHYLNLDIDMSTSDFLVESSFIATDVYLGNEPVYFNGTLYTAIMVPDTELLFSANDCVYCVIDMKHKKIVVTDIHKAACDSLIVFNNFSNNPTTQFPSQNNILFSKSITIVNDTDKYQDIIMGGCVILENAMSEDGVGSFAMYLDVYFNGKHTYRYTLDCTRKHECLCFDHLFKNVKTNEPIDIYVQYSYGTHIYGGSYVSPTIYNNNVTFYIEGANISYGDSSNIFTYTISDETHSGTSGYGSSLPYATVTGVINSSLTAYRVPDYCTIDGVKYPVKQFSLSTTLPNCKYIAFGNNMEVIICNYVYTNDMNQSPLYSTDYVSAEQSGYFKNKGVIVVYPDSGVRYIYGSDNYNNTGGFYNDQKSYVINGNPERLLYLYYDIGGSSLPRGEYPSLTFDNVGIFYCDNSSMSFRKTNNLTINAKLIGRLYYSNTYYSYRNTSYPGIAALTQQEGSLSIQEPDDTIMINLNCEACNTYYLMYYYHCGRAVWGIDDGVEYDDYKGYDTSVFFPNVVRFYEQKIIFNINGTLIYSSNAYGYISNLYSPETFIKLLTDISESSSTGEISYSVSTPSPSEYNYTVSSYNSWSMVYNYASSLGFNAAVRPWLIINVKGDCYSSLYTSLYYVQIKVNIDGNLHCIPMGAYCYLYNNPFPDSYIQNDYYYRDGYYYASDWEVKGTYDISKSFIKTVVRRITERRGWYFDDNGNKLPSYKYFTKVWEPDYAIAPSINLASLCSYGLSNTYYFKRFKVHRLAGMVYIPTKYTNTSSYSMYPKAKEGDITTRPDYSYFYTNTWTDFSYDEIADDTIILSFGMRDLTSDPIDFSKISCIGNLYCCNILRIELEDPVVAFLVPPDPSYFYKVYNYKNTGNYIYDTPDGQWDPNWHTYDDQYDAYIEFNAVCLGNIILQYESEKIPDEEVEENMYIKYRLNCSSTSDEDIAEMEEYLSTLTEEQRESDSSHNYRKAECDYYRLKLPKKSNIALGVEDFEFDRTSSFSFASYYTTINNEFVVYPQIKLYDCTKYIGSGFLYNHPYYPEGDGDIITLPANLKFFGNRSFRYTMYKKETVGSSVYFRQVQLNDNYSYYGYKAGETSTSTFDFIEDSVFEGYPISEVRIGKYLEVLPEVFPYADRMTIDPENPNFVISNGYIFSPDMKTLYRPVCYTELATIEPTDQNKYVFQSSVLESIVDFRSFKNDRRITGIEITSDRLVIKPNSSAVLYLPENCDRIILPSGDYTILDSDFDKLSYIEFLNITPTSKYYTIPGSEAGDVYSNFNKTYYYTMNDPNSMSSSWQSFSVTGSRMIFIRPGANVTIPNTCIELGGKVQTGIVTIQQDKITELNVSSPNVKIEGYDIAGANSIFFKDGTDAYYTVDGQIKSDFLWSRMNRNTGSQSSTTVFLYKVPTGPEIDTMTINLDYDKYISPAALKYCNISNLIISARTDPNTGNARNTHIFKIPITTESYKSSVPYGFFNDYDKTLHYDDESVADLTQYAVSTGNRASYNYGYIFNQTHYNDEQFFFNKLCMPVLNNHLDSLTIDFDPTLLVGRIGWNGIYISTGITLKQANNNYSATFSRMYYSGNEWLVNYWVLPEIDDFYINYDYTSGNAIFLPFPVDEKFKNIHFNPANIAGIARISSLVVCAAGVKIFPSDLLDQITNHSYKLYYCPDTNLSLSATSYTNHTFGEQSGCPFPSNSTITLTTCFVHPLFVHPEVCSGINLVLTADTKFGFSTQIITDPSLVGTNKNMLNQYSDYIRSWSSTAYFNGTTDQLGKYFYLFSPALSKAAYMAKQLAVFSHITAPRLFTYLFRAANISSSDDTYKIFNGSWFELNCATLVSIPYFCFDVDTTDNVEGSGYNLFTYQQFHDMLLDLTSIDSGNKIQIPTNPNGDTDYVLNSNLIDWKAPFVSKQQKRIDSWTITNSTFNGFVDRNVLLHFIDHIIYSGTATAFMIFGKINGSGSSASYNYNSTNDTYRNSYTYFTGTEDITVTIDPGSLSDPVVIDFGGARVQDIQNASIRNYLKPTSLYHNNFIMDFTANKNYVIRQICMPNCDSEELDFTQYPTCNFVLGDSTNFYATTDYARCFAKISGFKRVVLGSNVSIYQGNGSSIPALPNILFYSAQVEEIEYLGSEVYGITNYSGENNISTTFGNNITNFDTIFCGAGINSGHIEVDLNRVETIVGWSQYTTYTDQNTIGYAFCYCDFTNSSFDHLISIASNGGIKFSVFASQISMPNLTSIGTSGMRENTGIEELSIPLCTSLGEYAFYRNTSLTTLSAPSLVTIGNYAFYDCPISGVLTLESAETVGQHAFNSLDITEVHLPSATNIADNAFYDCRNITKAYIPAGCTISITSFFNNTEIVRT